MPDEASWLENETPRLGDLIDDHCPRCKLLLNHAIASFANGRVAKVICQTCYSEHPFMEGKDKKKIAKTQSTAFDQVLAKVSPSGDAPATPGRKKPSARARYISRRQSKPPDRKK